ncbi:MAG: insulinase family protein [bacterium]|nr:insulinase family protein [bacterium]
MLRFAHRYRILKTIPVSLILFFLLMVPCHKTLLGTSTLTFPVKTYILGNGLQVMLEQKATLPLVNIALSIKVGSKNDAPETQGAVHLLEHLIITRNNIIVANGLKDTALKTSVLANAETSRDLMTLVYTAPVDRIDYALEKLHERITNMDFDPLLLAKEKEVILEELAEGGTELMAVGLELVMKNLFKGHPYGYPIGGTKESLQKISLKDLNSIKQRFFFPGNYTLSLVGGFDIDRVTKKIETLFGSLKAQDSSLTAKKVMAPQPLTQNRFNTKELHTNMAHLFIGFRAPGIKHKDSKLVEVFAQVLGGGKYPLLAQQLNQRKQMVYHINAFYYPLEQEGVLLIHIGAPPETVNKAGTMLLRFLNREADKYNYSRQGFRFHAGNVFINYLENAIYALILRERQLEEEGINRAKRYCSNMFFNDATNSDSYGKLLKIVKSSTLQKAVTDYLKDKNYVAVKLVPAGM